MDYLPFEEALLKAKEESRLIHHIVLWGSLDDQSCWGMIYCFNYKIHIVCKNLGYFFSVDYDFWKMSMLYCRIGADSTRRSTRESARYEVSSKEFHFFMVPCRQVKEVVTFKRQFRRQISCWYIRSIFVSLVHSDFFCYWLACMMIPCLKLIITKWLLKEIWTHH